MSSATQNPNLSSTTAPARPWTVALVGRPNVGKSSLMNALLGFRRAIVLDMPGTTRDEVIERVKWSEKPMRLVDSQGILSETDQAALDSVLTKADAVLFVVDAMVGPTPFDRWLAQQVKVARKPSLLVINKGEKGAEIYEFAELGFTDSLVVSAAHRQNLHLIREWMLKTAKSAELPPQPKKAKKKKKEPHPDLVIPEGAMPGLERAVPEPAEVEVADFEEPLEAEPAASRDAEPLMLALIGRPNAGKSTLMNRLCRERVSRVSPEPLTTRDPVSFELDTPRGMVRLIDTAGIRRPRSQKEQIEVYSIQASTRAIRAADVVFLLIASHEGVTDQDMRLLNLIEREGKPLVILLNFWDRLTAEQRHRFINHSDFGPILRAHQTLPISGLTGWQVERLVPMAFRISRAAKRRVRTSQLNRFVERLVANNPPPTRGRATFNILYASQVRTEPPTFVFFMNRKANLPPSYQKYVENSLRDHLGFKGQTIRVFFRGNEGRD